MGLGNFRRNTGRRARTRQGLGKGRETAFYMRRRRRRGKFVVIIIIITITIIVIIIGHSVRTLRSLSFFFFSSFKLRRWVGVFYYLRTYIHRKTHTPTFLPFFTYFCDECLELICVVVVVWSDRRI